MFRVVQVLGFCLAVAFPALASPNDEIRALARQGDVEAIEARMQALHDAATKSGDFTALRQVNTKVFASTDPDVMTFLKTWAEAEPNSAYAWAGSMWNHLHIAGLWRGTKPLTRTYPAALDAYRAEVDLAVTAAIQAYDADPAYVPASDAMIVASTYSARIDPEPVFAAVMAETPNRKTLRSMIHANSPEWGGSAEVVIQLCTDYADAAPDYDVDLCLIEAGLRHRMPNEMRMFAATLLPERDEPFLDELRFESFNFAMINGVMQPDELVALHQRALNSGISAEDYLRAAKSIAQVIDDPSYLAQAKSDIDTKLDAQIAADPMNHRLILARVVRLTNRAPGSPWVPEALARARALWKNALVFGSYQSDVWTRGAWLAVAEGHEPARRGHLSYPYLANATALDPFPVDHLGLLLELLYSDYRRAIEVLESGETELDPGGRDPHDIIAASRCSLLRLTRLIEAYCEVGDVELECRPHLSYMEKVEKVRAIPDIETVCAPIAEAPIEELVLEAVPYAQFSDWVPETAPGMQGAR